MNKDLEARQSRKCSGIERSSIGREFRAQRGQEKSSSFRIVKDQSLKGLEIIFSCPFPFKGKKKKQGLSK